LSPVFLKNGALIADEQVDTRCAVSMSLQKRAKKNDEKNIQEKPGKTH
jgi:hypothetical protein